jgi:hypothetical protein
VPEVTTAHPSRPEHHPAFKWGVIITLVVVALLVGGVVGYLGWQFKAGDAPDSTPTQIAPPAPSAKPPSTSTVVAEPVPPVGDPAIPPTVPTKTPASTASTPATREPSQKPTVQPSATSTATQRPGPAAPQPLSSTSSPIPTTVGPGVTANTGVAISGSNASPAFRSFVANAKITGVFQGRNPRAVINGKVTHLGDTVDHSLGIVFHSIESARKQIVFKDKTGAIATRKY